MQTMELVENQSIHIGTDIELTLLGVRRGKVHLRITTARPVLPGGNGTNRHRGSTIALIPVPRNPRFDK